MTVELLNVLVLCTGNSCRSQIAEGYIRHFAGSNIIVRSAGLEIHGVNPLAVKVMSEDGIDISDHTSNHMDEYKQIKFNYVITVCDHANEVCPVSPDSAIRLHRNFQDTAQAYGSEEEVYYAFITVRDEVKKYIRSFVTSNLN